MEERKEFLQDFRLKLGYQEKSFFNDEIIVEKNRKDKNIYVINSGVVKVVDVGEDGDFRTLILLKTGEAFPLIWGFDHPSATSYRYQSMGQSELYVGSLDDFKKQMSLDPEFTKNALEMFVRLTWDCLERIKGLQASYTTSKLEWVLPYLAAKTGKKVKALQYKIPNFVTQVEISNLIGTSRESISAHITKVKKSKIFKDASIGKVIDLAKIPADHIYDRWFNE